MKVRIIAGIALAIALLSGLLFLSNLRSELVGLRANLAVANQTIADLQAAGERYEQANKARDAVDAKYTKELTNALAENDNLRTAVSDGRKRLLVKATCPSVRAGADAGPAVVVDGATAELSADARQDYHRLRDDLITSEKKLAGLQAYVATVCLNR